MDETDTRQAIKDTALELLVRDGYRGTSFGDISAALGTTRANAGGGLTGDHVGTTQTGAAGNINLTNAAVTINNPMIWSTRNTVPPDGNPHPIGDDQGSGSQNSSGYVVAYFPYQPVGPDGIYPWSAISGAMNINANSGLETRPTNIYAMWIMKT